MAIYLLPPKRRHQNFPLRKHHDGGRTWNIVNSKRKWNPHKGGLSRFQLMCPAPLAFDRRRGGYRLSADPDKKEEEQDEGSPS